MVNAFSMEECTDLLGVSKDTVKRLLKKGKLDPVLDERKRETVGRRKRLITVSSIARYVNESQIRRNIK